MNKVAKNITVTKYSGETTPFDMEKLRQSLKRSGTEEDVIEAVVEQVLQSLYEGITTKEIYKKAYEQIAKSNNTEAIQNLVNDLVVKGKQYRKFNFDQVSISLLRQMVQKQKTANLSNKFNNIEIIRTGIAKLIQ